MSEQVPNPETPAQQITRAFDALLAKTPEQHIAPTTRSIDEYHVSRFNLAGAKGSDSLTTFEVVVGLRKYAFEEIGSSRRYYVDGNLINPEEEAAVAQAEAEMLQATLSALERYEAS